IAVMYLGRIVERAPARGLFAKPAQPYTQALLSAIPIPDPMVEKQRRRIALVGEVPSPLDPPMGCHFHTRCPHGMDDGKATAPAVEERAPGHFVACHLKDAPQVPTA